MISQKGHRDFHDYVLAVESLTDDFKMEVINELYPAV